MPTLEELEAITVAIDERLIGIENMVYNTPPYDPATVKGIYAFNVDTLQAYLYSAGKTPDVDGKWSLPDVLLSMVDQIGFSVNTGTYILQVAAGTILVQGFDGVLAVGDQVAITTDENFEAVSATFNDTNAQAQLIGRVDTVETKVETLETTVNEIDLDLVAEFNSEITDETFKI